VPAVEEIGLPGGLRVGGARRRDAALRPLTGADEAFLGEEAGGLLPAQRTTALLARCLERLGPLAAPVPPDAVAALGAGDREALLLHLRRISIGDRVRAVVACPHCAEAMDLDLRVGDLLVAPYDAWPEHHEAVVDGRTTRFRLPTGADQEAVAPAALDDPRAAAALLLARCVEGEVTPAVAEAVPELMAELDPQAEIVLDAECAACGGRLSAPFDPGDYLYREVLVARHGLLRQIHTLALNYGWSERDILALPSRKRATYLGLLAEDLEASEAG
jgi:hypothetical protein